MIEEQIDIVIPWVDGNDPVHKAKINAYRAPGSQREDVGGNSRFDSIGEIYYCVKSILKFAPFIRKIFIITDGQDPHLETELEGYAPHGKQIPIEIIDHKVIFRGYEEYLPVFNSRAIETLLWRIPDLSERFILMNDDFMFIRPVTANDFFDGEKTYCYADLRMTFFAKIIRSLRNKGVLKHKISFKESMLKALDVMGGGSVYLYLGHTPRPLRKSFYENFYSASDALIKSNIRHKFRNMDQFNSQELFYIHEYRHERLNIVPKNNRLAYLLPRDKKNYIDRKLKKFDMQKDIAFCCINALCLAPQEEQHKVLNWVKRRLSEE